MLHSARRRSMIRGHAFCLTVDDVLAMHAETGGSCPVTGRQFCKNKGARGPGIDSPSLDRIDDSKGYTPENTRLVSFGANTRKKRK